MKDRSGLRQEIIQEMETLPEDQLRAVLAFVESLRRKRSSSTPSIDTPSIEEKIKAYVDEVPDEAWEEVPADASEHLDQYLYGTPNT